MSRVLLALVIAAGVVYAPSPSSAEPVTSTKDRISAKTKAPTKAEKSKKKKTAKKKKKKKKKKSRTKVVSRTPSKSSLRNHNNMPRGYEWPPTKQMLAAEKACEAKLDELGIVWLPAKPEGRIVSAITISDSAGVMSIGGITYKSAYRKGPHKLDCQLALALHELGPDLLATGVREIKFGSIYRWTNVRVNGQTKNVLSRHALGIAMDIVSFTDMLGREANVEKDYPTGDVLLLSVEAAVGASNRFRVLLTPKNDPVSHHDHFHLEVAVDYTRADQTAALP